MKKMSSSLEVDTEMVVRCAQVSVRTGDADGTQDDQPVGMTPTGPLRWSPGSPPEPQTPFMRTSKPGAGSVKETTRECPQGAVLPRDSTALQSS